MNTSPASSPPSPSRFRWLKSRRLLLAALLLSLFVGALLVAGLLYVRSERFTRYLASEIEQAARNYGLRVEVGGLDFSWKLFTVRLRDLKVFNLQTGQQIATVKATELKAELLEPYALRLNREIVLETLHLSGVDLYVNIDKDGRSNFAGLHQPPPRASRITFDWEQLVTSLNDARLHFNDEQRKLSADLNELRATAQTAANEQIKIQFNAGASRFAVEGRELALDGLDLAALANQTGATIERLQLRSPAAEVKADGRIEDWTAFRYGLNLEAQADLGETLKLFAPDTATKGTGKAQGRLEGEAGRFAFKGQLQADELIVNELQLRNAAANGAEVFFNDGKLNFTAERASAAALNTNEARLNATTANNIKGEFIDGVLKVSAAAIIIGQAAVAGGQISQLALRGVDATVRDGRVKARTNAALASANFADVRVGQASAQAVLDGDVLNLNGFKASVLGGNATGDAIVQLTRTGTTRVKTRFNDLKTQELFALAAVKQSAQQVPVTGTVSGAADIAFNNANARRLSGTLNARFNGQGTQNVDGIPINGDVALRAQEGAFNIEQLKLTTDVTTVEATGRVTFDGNSDLRVSLATTDASQLLTIAKVLEGTEKYIREYEPLLTGELKFDGRVTGPLDKAALEGDLTAASVGMRDALLGSLTGRLFVSPSELRVQNGVLTASNGGTAKFDLATPLDPQASGGRLDATIERIDLEAILAAAGAPSAMEFIKGEVTGEAHLTGLPATPQGKGRVSLLNGVIAEQAAELAEAEFTLDGKNLLLDRVEARVLQSRLLANGRVNIDDKTFQVQGKAEQIALDRLANTFEIRNVNIAGTADADFRVSGAVDKLEALNVELTAQAPKVLVNGRDTGALTLTARTNASGRIEAELNTGIIASTPATAGAAPQPQVVKASIELRQPGRPVEITSDLVNVDLAPLLAAFAPDAAATIAGAVTGRLRIAGPTVNARGEATAAELRGALTLNNVALKIDGNDVTIETPVTVALSEQQVRIENTRISGQGINLSLGGTLGLQENAGMNFTLNGAVDLTKIPSLNPDLTLSGAVAIDARVTGTAAAPNLNGVVNFERIGVASNQAPAAIEDGNGRFVFAGDKATLENFRARVNEGELTINGEAKFANLRPSEWRYNITARNVDVIFDEVRATLSGDLTLTGNQQGQTLSGLTNVFEAEYTANIDLNNLITGRDTLSLTSFSSSGVSSRSKLIPPINLDVRVDARDSLFVRDDEINTVASAALTLRGTLDNPSVTGRVSAEGGRILFRGQRYEVTTATVDLPGGSAPPVVNVQAEGETSSYRVYIGFVGPLDALDLTLRSEPDLTRDEILALITTGRTEGGGGFFEDPLRSGFGAVGSLLASELTRPAEQLLGINRFQIDPVLRPNANPAARVTIGQQLARGLYFTYSTNLAAEQDQTAFLEYTLTNRFSLLASYTQGGSSVRQGIGTNDFTVEIRGRKRFSLGFKPPLATASTTDAGPPPTRPALPGAEVQVVAPGVELSNRRLRELLPVKTQGFSRSLARLGQRRLRTYLQEKGYFFAEVNYRCEPAACSGPDLQLSYDVEPGERYELTDVRFEGTEEVSVSDLAGQLQSQPAGLLGGVPFFRSLPLVGGLKRGLTSNERIGNDAETIRRYLADRGFRDARVRSRLAVTEAQDLIVVFSVEEGPRSYVADIAMRGNQIIPAWELRETVPVRDEQPFSLTIALAGVQQIKQFYAQRGFLDTNVELEVTDVADDRVRLFYNINEGQQARVAEVEITGTTKTRLNWVRRYYDFKTGEVLTPAKIRRTQRDLYATGAFREVNIRTEPLAGRNPDDDTAQRVTINLTEAKPLLFIYGLGYSTDDGARGLLQLTNTNLWGTLDSASLRLRASRREQFAQFSFTDLRPFGYNWPAQFSVFYNRSGELRPFVRRRELNEDGKVVDGTAGRSFGLQRFAAFIQTERKFNDRTSLRLRYNLERANLFNLQNVPETEVTRNERAIRLGMFSVGLSRDTRDNILNPTRGQLISADHSLATRVLGGNESFNKFFGTYQRYKTLDSETPVLGRTTLAFAARFGLGSVFRLADRNNDQVISESERRLPISERFFSGGATTLRGFRFETAGPQAVLEPRKNTRELPTLVPLGGDALMLFNFELRYPLTQRVRLVPFYDLGNVFYRVRDINWARMTSTVGMGLQVITPLGPVGVDYGYLLDPPAFQTATGAVLRQQRGVIHIRFGQTF